MHSFQFNIVVFALGMSFDVGGTRALTSSSILRSFSLIIQNCLCESHCCHTWQEWDTERQKPKQTAERERERKKIKMTRAIFPWAAYLHVLTAWCLMPLCSCTKPIYSFVRIKHYTHAYVRNEKCTRQTLCNWQHRKNVCDFRRMHIQHAECTAHTRMTETRHYSIFRVLKLSENKGRKS